MLYLTVQNSKNFMSLLLKNSLFDDFEVRLINIQTFVTFDINCKIDKDFFDEENIPVRDFSLWSELKTIYFSDN